MDKNTYKINTEPLRNGSKGKFFLVLSVVVIGFLIAGINSCFTIIEAGSVGVVLRLGAAKDDVLTPGFHFKLPFIDKIVPINTRLLNLTTDAASASKDLQNVKTEVAVQYSIVASMASNTYKSVGNAQDIADKIISPAILESVKAVTAQYTAEAIVTQRSKVKIEIQEAIDRYIGKTLSSKNIENALTIANVAITDFDFSAEFNRAIEMKVKTEQEALQAKNEKLKRVTQAEASAAEKKLATDAEAYQIQISNKAQAEAAALRIELTSKAKADAIKREAAALKDHPELIQLRIAEKWDGKLPYYSAGKDAIPMLSLEKK